MGISDSSSGVGKINSVSNELQKTFQKLSSGKRINSAKDDAAGLAVAAALAADVVTSLQGARNASDGSSIVAIADSALGQISDITSRQQELAAQASNGTLSDTQRQSLDAEYQSLEQEKNRISQTTTFNGVSVFSGTSLQVGNDGSSNSSISTPAVSLNSITSAQSIATQNGARAALDANKEATDNINKLRGDLGAVSTRLDSAASNAQNRAVESQAAEARITDADIASEAANLTSQRIRQNATVAFAAQAAKINGDTTLKLLQ